MKHDIDGLRGLQVRVPVDSGSHINAHVERSRTSVEVRGLPEDNKGPFSCRCEVTENRLMRKQAIK
jgi:hypothetical protein